MGEKQIEVDKRILRTQVFNLLVLSFLPDKSLYYSIKHFIVQHEEIHLGWLH